MDVVPGVLEVAVLPHRAEALVVRRDRVVVPARSTTGGSAGSSRRPGCCRGCRADAACARRTTASSDPCRASPASRRWRPPWRPGAAASRTPARRWPGPGSWRRRSAAPSATTRSRTWVRLRSACSQPRCLGVDECRSRGSGWRLVCGRVPVVVATGCRPRGLAVCLAPGGDHHRDAEHLTLVEHAARAEVVQAEQLGGPGVVADGEAGGGLTGPHTCRTIVRSGWPGHGRRPRPRLGTSVAAVASR